MSPERAGRSSTPRTVVARAASTLTRPRVLALASTAVLLASFTSVLYYVVDVAGDPTQLLVLVGVTLVVATGCSRALPVAVALGIGIALLVAGLGLYVTAIPVSVRDLVVHAASDLSSLLTGLSVLRLQAIEVWALAVTPTPVFLTWYLALRRHYVAAVVGGGGALSFFVLTGDVGTTTTLFGALGALGTVGFGRLERFEGAPASATPTTSDGVDDQRRTLLVGLGAAAAVTTTVSVVPGSRDQPIGLLGDAGQRTLEGSLVRDDQRVTVQGAIELSPEVRFTVKSSEAAYWRAGSYDRYTGAGWVRTDPQAEFTGRQRGPPGPSETVTQEYVIESVLDTMPAVWRPVHVSGPEADDAEATEAGDLQPGSPFGPGDEYAVTSERPTAAPADLVQAGTNYPTEIREQYTQTPASTPDRVRERTERIVAEATTPYEAARLVERWLAANREYSLEIDRPDGDVADAFLFEMSAGYCTYFATTMAVMLRTQDIPARFVVGYSQGEHDGDEWVVRGLHSHAWVEVFFPRYGWIQFDPTPTAPREAAHRSRLESEGLLDDTGGDDEETDEETDEPDTTTETRTGETPPGEGIDDPAIPTASGDTGGGVTLPDLPPPEHFALGGVVLAGLAAGLRRTGLSRRAYEALWLRYQPRENPTADVDRAFERLSLLLEREHRPRRDEETPRQYLEAVGADERAWRVYEHYERARYAGEVSATAAEEAVALVDELVAERRPLSGT